METTSLTLDEKIKEKEKEIKAITDQLSDNTGAAYTKLYNRRELLRGDLSRMKLQQSNLSKL